MRDGTDSIEDTAARLVLLREWAGYSSQSAFARRSGLQPSELNHFESGRRPLSLLAANKLRLHWRVTLDWLYHGDRGGLAVETANSLPHLGPWRRSRQGSPDGAASSGADPTAD